ncbi:MAG: hydroxymethylbilane synthase, partial [Deltaproteobacteria bacterium]
IGGHARVEGGRVRLDALVGALDGTRVVRGGGEAPLEGAEALGREVAEEILRRGGRAILEEVYAASAEAEG